MTPDFDAVFDNLAKILGWCRTWYDIINYDETNLNDDPRKNDVCFGVE